LRKNYFTIGLLTILLGLIFVAIHNNSADVETYTLVDKYEAGERHNIEVTGFFKKGDHFYFNFSPGIYWGGDWEIFEPGCDLGGAYIPQHKIVFFDIYTPSNETCSLEARLPYGMFTFAIIYYNRSSDFTPLPDGNLTFTGAGIEGIVNKTGSFTIRATGIYPIVYETKPGEGRTFQIEDDPPRIMTLWKISKIETKPYAILLPFGIILVLFGVILDIWSVRGRRTVKRQAYRRTKRHKMT